MFGRCHSKSASHGWGRQYGKYASAGKFGYRRPKYNVPLNIAQTESGYEVHVYALGFSKENIRISVADEVLYISGTREFDEASAPDFLFQEYPVRSFERTVYLNEKVDSSQISARHENGILVVTLPRKADAAAQAAEIQID